MASRPTQTHHKCLSKLPDRRAEGAVMDSSTGWQEATRGVSVSERQNGKLIVVPSQQIRQKYETS